MMGRTSRRRRRKRKNFETKSEDININRLMQWTLQFNVFMKGITTKNFFKTGKGIKTTRKVEPDTLIISLPREFLITFDTVWYRYIQYQSIPNLKSTKMTAKDLFILMLIRERRNKKKSKYNYYIHSVPETYTTVSNIEANEFYLLPSFILEETQNQHKKIERHFNRIQKSEQLLLSSHGSIKSDNILISEVKWAWNLLNTRSVYFNPSLLKCKTEINVLEVDFALAPLLDMLNHSSGAEVEAGFNVPKNAYQITTFNSYKRGEQVFINYGAHSNRTLLTEYGFILPDNIHADVPIAKELFFKYFCGEEPNQRLLYLTTGRLKNAGVSLDNINCTTNGLDWSFITAAHLIVLQEDFSTLFPPKCHTQVCLIFDRSKLLLKHVLEEYTIWIDKIENYEGDPSEALIQVRSLLKLEKDTLQRTLEQLNGHCMLS